MKPSHQTTPASAGTLPALRVALDMLDLSAGNVRKTSPTRIVRLAAMILAQSLLHPLFVSVQVDAQGQPTGRYFVEAGGRRLRALRLLAERGDIFDDMPIDCRLVDTSSALEISLIENISQEPMHPADEFAAYAELIASGRSVEAVAQDFGVTVAHVSRRLKMANVAPSLLALYRDGEMTLDQVRVLASVDDQERQVLVWNGLSSYQRHPQMLKTD